MRGPFKQAPGARRLLLAAACLGLVMTAGRADAGWPTPAGGPSASGDPEVLFTFDDGPHEKYTAAILDELDRRGIQAIFFWVGHRIARGGRVQKRLALVHRAVREGHLVANHTINHANLCQVGVKEAAYEIDDNMRMYEQATGLPMLLFRAPYGARCKRLERLLAERSLHHMHWDIDPKEWEHHDTKRTVAIITRRLDRLQGRAIIIMHDTHKVTAKALPRILDWIEKENQRRRERGDKRPIRIIGGSDLIIERLDAGALEWAADATVQSATRLQSVLDRLVP